jgi:fructoselysine transporter
MQKTDQPHLTRGLNLTQATAINMIDMVGIGPFIVLPFVIHIMGGPHFIFAWIAGALLSLIDGMVWAELGAANPKAGGSYNFLKEAYGHKWGRLMSFLYVWQTVIMAPLVAASGAIGFSGYCKYLIPSLTSTDQKMISASVIVTLVLLLYRKIETIGKISVVLWITVLTTLLWMITGGITHPLISNDWTGGLKDIPATIFFVGLGQATVQTIYSYLGYYNVCHLGGEIRSPEKNIPRSIFISIIGIAILYLSLNISVVSVIPWQEAQFSEFIVSTFIEKIYGPGAAVFATILVLIVAFSSLFAVLLGYSRIPYAAALDGRFFPAFAKLHPKRNFPYVSLLALGTAAFFFSLLFKLTDVIKAILAMRIIIQFIGQAAGAVLLRRRLGTRNLPFRMWLYPLPVILAILIWSYIFFSTGNKFMISGLIVIAAGVLVYFLAQRYRIFEKRKSDSVV